jgi:hypothetical protein
VNGPPVQLSRHAYLTRADGALVARNALFATSLRLSEEEWLALRPFGRPRPAADGPGALIARALEARILSGAPERPTLEIELVAPVFSLLRALCEAAGLTRPQLDQLLGGAPDLRASLRLARSFVEIFSRKERQRLAEAYPLIQDPEALRVWDLYLRDLLEHALILDEECARGEPYEMDAELLLDLADRPVPDRRLDQLACMPVSTCFRADLVDRDFPMGARALALGDDDFVGLALAARGRHEVHVLEADERIAAAIRRAIARRGVTNLTLHVRDLHDGLPAALRGGFDAVVTDPPYVAAGMGLFITAARAALRRGGPTKLYLSTNPDLLQDARQFHDDLLQSGLLTLRRHHRRGCYRIAPQERETACRLIRLLGVPIAMPEQQFVVPYWYADLFELIPLEPLRARYEG